MFDMIRQLVLSALRAAAVTLNTRGSFVVQTAKPSRTESLGSERMSRSGRLDLGVGTDWL